jgi:exodeoxyribonuclease VII large subunit
VRSVSAPTPVPVSVGRLARYIKARLGDDPKLRFIAVRGEVSNLRVQDAGHVYFDLKDAEALINVVMWSDAAAQLPPFKNGASVVAVGGVTTYPKRSTYQLNAVRIELDGVGRLHELYERLREQLKSEGLFEASRKRALPRYPFAIALISSANSDGARDFITNARRRAPHVRVQLVETAVQGPNAPGEIVAAIKRAEQLPVDVIVLARGGGSYEDLFVFSDERVVRALATAKRPTVSAIGHESDSPLTDFVADVRALTPTAATELILPDRAQLLGELRRLRRSLETSLHRKAADARLRVERFVLHSVLGRPSAAFGARRQLVDDLRERIGARVREGFRAESGRLIALERRLAARDPRVRLGEERRRVVELAYRMDRAVTARIGRWRLRIDRAVPQLRPGLERALTARKHRLALAVAELNGKNPTTILSRGYAMVLYGGRAVTDPAVIPVGTQIIAQVARGTITARVESTESHG